MPGTVPGACDTTINKTEKYPFFHEGDKQCKRKLVKYIKCYIAITTERKMYIISKGNH